MILKFFRELFRFFERIVCDYVLRLDPALGQGFVAGPDAEPRHLFKLHLIEDIQPVATFYFKEIFADCKLRPINRQ